jgi:ketosteroid isomerase-like protein
MGRNARARAALAAALAAIVIGACGGDGEGSDEDAVRETVSQFVRATDEQDFPALCQLLAESEVRSIERQGSGACTEVLRAISSGPSGARARIEEVRISEDRASVDATFIREDGTRAPLTLRLVKEDGDWKIAAVGG